MQINEIALFYFIIISNHITIITNVQSNQTKHNNSNSVDVVQDAEVEIFLQRHFVLLLQVCVVFFMSRLPIRRLTLGITVKRHRHFLLPEYFFELVTADANEQLLSSQSGLVTIGVCAMAP